MRVLLVRHGATRGSEERRYCGKHTDEPLSDAGKAALAGLDLGFAPDRVVTSGMLRCAQTADTLFPGQMQLANPGLAEMDFGVFEGKSYAELSGDAAYQAWVDSYCETACPQGESKASFTQRCVAAFSDELRRAKEAFCESIAFVVHAGTIRAVTSELLEPPIPYFDASTPCGGAWVCDWDGMRLSLVRRPDEAAAQA